MAKKDGSWLNKLSGNITKAKKKIDKKIQSNKRNNKSVDINNTWSSPFPEFYETAGGNPFAHALRKQIYDNLYPAGYGRDDTGTLRERANAVLFNEPEYLGERHKNRDDIFATYLGIPESERYDIGAPKVELSEYKPSNSKDNIAYYSIPWNSILRHDDGSASTTVANTFVEGAGITPWDLNKNKVASPLNALFGDHTVSSGYDDKGHYYSYYDRWDINPFYGKSGERNGLLKRILENKDDISLGIGTPIEFYNRLYLDDYYGVPGNKGLYLPPLEVYGAKHSYGGPLIQQANKFGDGGPKRNKKQREPYYGIYGNVSPYIGEGSPILQYDAEKDEWLSDTWSDDLDRVKEEKEWYKNAPESFRNNYRMIVDLNGGKVKYVTPEQQYLGSWRNKDIGHWGGATFGTDENGDIVAANPFDGEIITGDGRLAVPVEGMVDDYGNQIYEAGNDYYIEGKSPNEFAEGGSLNTPKQWKDLSVKEKSDIMKVAIRNGITNLPDIRNKYNEFAAGGNIYGLGSVMSKASKVVNNIANRVEAANQAQQSKDAFNLYSYLPMLFTQDGVNIYVTSGYREGAKVKGKGNRSRHSIMNGAADIVPTGKSTFADIRRVLDNPQSNTAKWLASHGYGYLDETSATGTTKYWHDYNKDHSHYHIGQDYGNKYTAWFNTAASRPGQEIFNDGDYINIAKDYIRRNESFRRMSYADAPKGKNWRSTGYGFNDSGFWSKYPGGISKYYDARGGITEAEAEQELEWILRNSTIPYLERTYGSSWNNFTPQQKAAIIDTAYQSPNAVGNKSRFYRAIIQGDPNAINYLGVTGYDKRNNIRRSLYNSRTMPNITPIQQQQTIPDNLAYGDIFNYNPLYDNMSSPRPGDYTMAENSLLQQSLEDSINAFKEQQVEEERQRVLADRQQKRNNLNFFLGMSGFFGDNSSSENYFMPGIMGLLSNTNSNQSAYGGNLYKGGSWLNNYTPSAVINRAKNRVSKKRITPSEYVDRAVETVRNVARETANKQPEIIFDALAEEMPRYRDVNIPWIEDKAITLTNAGKATGARLSTNMLDSIAKYADEAGLPIDTAVGLAIKETTLGNPTNDASLYYLAGSPNRKEAFKKWYAERGTRQYINPGVDIAASNLINMHYSPNPYKDALAEAREKSVSQEDFNRRLLLGLDYANRKATSLIASGELNKNVLQAGLEKYRNSPRGYNSNQRNHPDLVAARAMEIQNSPEYQRWKRSYNKKK